MGRMSRGEPALQNIPIPGSDRKLIEAFHQYFYTDSQVGQALTQIDFSAIENRILQELKRENPNAYSYGSRVYRPGRDRFTS